MKNLNSIVVMLILFLFACVASAQTNITPPVVSNPSSFTQITNIVFTNGIAASTNNFAGLTNKIAALSTNSTAQLFSIFDTNIGTFYGSTNGGIISFLPYPSKPFYRFITVRVSGTAVTNVSAAIGTGNYILKFAGSDLTQPTASQTETTPSWTIQFPTPALGAFNIVTNIEFDALGSWQLASWQNTCTNSYIQNPSVSWRLAY